MRRMEKTPSEEVLCLNCSRGFQKGQESVKKATDVADGYQRKLKKVGER